MKRFGKELKEHPTKIKVMKEKERLPLTHEENKSYKQSMLYMQIRI